MEKACIKSYLDIIEEFDDKDFLLNYIRYKISPTLKGIKPSYLMIFGKNKNRDFFNVWKEYKDYIKTNLNIEFIELKETDKSIHVLFYKSKILKNILKTETNRKFLSYFGYKNFDMIEECLIQLRNRYELSCSHEIGVFLGYPVHDVVHFIYPTKKECLLNGYWKVFKDKENAEKVFNAYDNCRLEIYNYMNKNKISVY